MKRCLLICEGPFDELIYSNLKNLFNESLLEIKSLKRCCVDIPNLKRKVETLIKEILSREHGYFRKDFDEICFLIDSDGIFIPEDSIIENKSINIVNYKNNEIQCIDKKSLINRNNIRKKNISSLLEDRKYYIFYNSRNLEHSFDESMIGSLNDSVKKRFALDTFNHFSNNPKEFIKKLFSMNRSNTLNIYKSWDYLKYNFNSLSSTSNVIIFVIMHYYALKEEYKEIIDNLLKSYK